MIASVVLGTFGLVATLIGMQCCKAAEDNQVLKGKLAGTGGVFFILQGKKPKCSDYMLCRHITRNIARQRNVVSMV